MHSSFLETEKETVDCIDLTLPFFFVRDDRRV